MKKIVSFVGILFAGYMIGIMTYASGDKIIGSTVSANGKYKLIYTAIRYGGIFPAYYRHYVEVREIPTEKRVMSWFVKSDDIKSRSNETYWDGDTIVMTDPDFYSNNVLQQVIATPEKIVFHFPKGFATQ